VSCGEGSRRVSWWSVRDSWVCRRSWVLKRLSRSCDSVVRFSCNCKRLCYKCVTVIVCNPINPVDNPIPALYSRHTRATILSSYLCVHLPPFSYSNTILYVPVIFTMHSMPCLSYIPWLNRHKTISVSLHIIKILIFGFAGMHTGFWWESKKESVNSEDLDVGGRIILKLS
jgi:hypothetical protein